MKKETPLFITFISIFILEVSWAQFESGSDGSLGALNITEDTQLIIPENGIFNYTTIDIAAGTTVTFLKNPLNSPIYLLASGDVNIAGIIDVMGQQGLAGLPGEGGPGGFAGGTPSPDGELIDPGDGKGPGGGKGMMGNAQGGGAYAANDISVLTNNSGTKYGNALLVPLVGGSGGGGGELYGGSGGAGAILIASSTKVNLESTGRIFAHSTTKSGAPTNKRSVGLGSGGAIRILAPVFEGTGDLLAHGYSTNFNGVNSFHSGNGRVRIDALDRSNWTGTTTGSASAGANMIVFPQSGASLSIISAAGQTISEGTTSSVIVNLPSGASTTQTIVVQGRDFTGIIPIQIVVTPDTGTSTVFEDQIDMGSGNPASVSVDVILTEGTPNHIHAWTK